MNSALIPEAFKMWNIYNICDTHNQVNKKLLKLLMSYIMNYYNIQ